MPTSSPPSLLRAFRPQVQEHLYDFYEELSKSQVSAMAKHLDEQVAAP